MHFNIYGFIMRLCLFAEMYSRVVGTTIKALISLYTFLCGPYEQHYFENTNSVNMTNPPPYTSSLISGQS